MDVALGPIWQLGYVVDDVEAAMQGWLAQGIGPWYVLDPLPIDEFSVRDGDPSTPPEAVVALTYSGGVQVELIDQRDQTPTLYLEFLARTGGGLQHLGYLPADYDAALAAARRDGWSVHHVGLAAGTRFAYLDSGNHNGTVAEIVDLDGTTESFFAHIQDEAATWDGRTKPIRRIGGR